MVIEIVEFTLKPGAADAFVQGWQQGVHYLQQQSGYISHAFGPQFEDPNIYMLQVQWQALADHHAFMASGDYAPFGASFRTHVEGKARVQHFDPLPGV